MSFSFWVKKKNGQTAQNVTILGLCFQNYKFSPGTQKSCQKWRNFAQSEQHFLNTLVFDTSKLFQPSLMFVRKMSGASFNVLNSRVGLTHKDNTRMEKSANDENFYSTAVKSLIT